MAKLQILLHKQTNIHPCSLVNNKHHTTFNSMIAGYTNIHTCILFG